jgi:hypothetical protein
MFVCLHSIRNLHLRRLFFAGPSRSKFIIGHTVSRLNQLSTWNLFTIYWILDTYMIVLYVCLRLNLLCLI